MTTEQIKAAAVAHGALADAIGDDLHPQALAEVIAAYWAVQAVIEADRLQDKSL